MYSEHFLKSEHVWVGKGQRQILVVNFVLSIFSQVFSLSVQYEYEFVIKMASPF